MPFFTPNHAIIEAIEYDGTPQCASEIAKWAKPQIVRPGISVSFADSKLFVLYFDRAQSMTDAREISKGDYIAIEHGSPIVISGEEFKSEYELVPLLDD